MSAAHIMHRIAVDVARLGHTAKFDEATDVLWIDGLGLKVHAMDPFRVNAVIEQICWPRAGNEATGTIHMVSGNDTRVSSCGMWWWSKGGEPARVLREVTCEQCRHTLDYRELGLDMEREIDRWPAR